MSTIEVGRILPKTEQITKSVDVFHEPLQPISNKSRLPSSVGRATDS